jgi:hypothetical protein
MGWRSQLLWPNLSGLKLEFQPENSKAPSEDPILQSQTTGIRIQRIDPHCEISEKARDGKISFAETEKIFFSYNPHENFPAKKMNKYFLHMKIFFVGKFSCEL